MKKDKARKAENELLELLKEVLPKATPDAQLAGKIYEAVEQELKAKALGSAFTKFCTQVEVNDLEPGTLKTLKGQLETTFSDGDITMRADKKAQKVAVELALTNGLQFAGDIKVASEEEGSEDEEGEDDFKPQFVPFPVSLPGDPELVWMLGKHETLNADEASIALKQVEENFWDSKAGQRLLQENVARAFPEFISHVPATKLTEAGIKRHYPEPEPVKVLHVSPEKKKAGKRASDEI